MEERRQAKDLQKCLERCFHIMCSFFCKARLTLLPAYQDKERVGTRWPQIHLEI